MPDWKEFPSAFVNPQSRGFEVNKLFSDYLGIPDGVGSDHPWKAPKCSEWNSLEDELEDENGEYRYRASEFDELRVKYKKLMEFDLIKYRKVTPMDKSDEYLLRALVDHVNGGRVWTDDLGQRINLAYRKALENDPEKLWLVYNVAGLFWRVNGSNVQALECIIRGKP